MKTLLIILNLTCTIPLYVHASEPVGTNDKGSLINGIAFPEAGEGFIGMYRDTNHFWGTSQIINMIETSAEVMEQKYPGRDRLQVEDIGLQAGGQIDGHGSHQNGLDADIGYYKMDGIEHDPILKNQKYADPMVVNGKVIANFDVERNWEFVKTLHRNGDVQKIFMDILLKQALCIHAKKIGDYKKYPQVLRSLRHVEGHKDHLHVRIRCPKDAKKCVNQDEPPKDIGC
jgi:penicillin-insensitive murein endopeptidase